MVARAFFALVLSTTALAAPFLSFQGCSVPSSVLQLPKNQTALTAPSTAPTFVTLGVGVQNYTCSNTSTYINVGALAELFDISCLYSTSLFPGIQDIAFAAWSALPADATTLEVERILRSVGNPDVVGQHYFVTSPSGSGTSPKFDFTSGRFNGNGNAYILAARVGDLPSPDSTSDIDWLSLNRVDGELADEVFRVDTRGGQPPASCTPGSPEISVRYVARYLFYGGSINSS